MDAGVYLKLLKSCVLDREIEEQPYNRKVRVRFPGEGFSLAHTFGKSTGVVPRKQNRERLV